MLRGGGRIWTQPLFPKVFDFKEKLRFWIMGSGSSLPLTYCFVAVIPTDAERVSMGFHQSWQDKCQRRSCFVFTATKACAWMLCFMAFSHNCINIGVTFHRYELDEQETHEASRRLYSSANLLIIRTGKFIHGNVFGNAICKMLEPFSASVSWCWSS